jgi:hypothetical protein
MNVAGTIRKSIMKVGIGPYFGCFVVGTHSRRETYCSAAGQIIRNGSA